MFMFKDDVFREMHQRGIYLVRLRVVSWALDSATFYYDHDSPHTFYLPPVHRCNCEFCRSNDPDPLLEDIECGDFSAYLDSLVETTEPPPHLDGWSGYDIVVYRDAECIGMDEGTDAPPQPPEARLLGSPASDA